MQRFFLRLSNYVLFLALFIIPLLSHLRVFSQENAPSEVQIPLEFRKGWNLFSVPEVPVDFDIATFFEGRAVGKLWVFEGGQYQVTNVLQPGVGYWIYLVDDLSKVFTIRTNESNDSSLVSVADGWNMKGVYSPIAIPSGLSGIPWKFENGQYVPANEPLSAGQAYWLHFPVEIEIPLGSLQADSDSDGIPDYWEHLWDFQYQSPDDKLVDPDTDELMNLGEYQEGTNPRQPDTDQDGLSDGSEVKVHLTRPDRSDSDDDGLTDGQEVNVYSTDPTIQDSDNDGLIDGEEVNTYGTDPMVVDTDEDSIDDGDEVNIFGTDPAEKFDRFSLTIGSPENQVVTQADVTEIKGTLSRPATVTVNGIEAMVMGNEFVVQDVPLIEGTNQLVVTAENLIDGSIVSETRSIRRDSTKPFIVFESPLNGYRLVTETVAVAGTVNDIIPGATVNEDDVTVTINGIVATVNNRTFFLPGLSLEVGTNTLTATAIDRAGNSTTKSIQVTREPDLPGVQILITAGNAQRVQINDALPEPLVVKVQFQDGTPEVGRPVTFEVSRGDGLLADIEDKLREVTILTDENGEGQVDFTVGSRTGEGFHRVLVTTPGSLSFAEFCATAETSAPANIAVVMNPPNQSLVGQPLAQPISAIVTDAGGNPVENVDVTFRARAGGGNFFGQITIVVSTNSDGIASTSWTLGPNPGVANNEATANFDENPGFPAAFIVSGVAPGMVDSTTVSGIVQDSSGNPIVGVKAVIRNTDLEAFTGTDGKFIITDVTPGGHHVGILGATANDPENNIYYPDIDFAIEVVSGVDNRLDQIVVLPFLDMENAKLAGGDEDVVLTMANVSGFSIKVFANSTFLRDPDTSELIQQPVELSSSQVKFDKIPMPPPQGSTPLVVGTLQPAGVIFDPPAQVCYPNVEGLSLGDVADIFAFHHDIGQFVNLGPGTVSEDGSVVCSDPGFGIVQSGWHCLIRIPGPTANCANGCSASAEVVNGQQISTANPLVLGVGESKQIKVTFIPTGGMLDSNSSWISANDAKIKVTGGASLTATVEGITPGVVTITSPTYRITLPPGHGGDKTCVMKLEVSTVEIDITKIWSNQYPNTLVNYLPGSSGCDNYPYVLLGANADSYANMGAEVLIFPNNQSIRDLTKVRLTTNPSDLAPDVVGDGTLTGNIASLKIKDPVTLQKYYVITWIDTNKNSKIESVEKRFVSDYFFQPVSKFSYSVAATKLRLFANVATFAILSHLHF